MKQITTLDTIINENYGLIIKQVTLFKPRNQDEFDDLVQVGSIGMIKAVRKYDPNREPKIKFATYATCCIRNELLNYLKKENKNLQFNNLAASECLLEQKKDIEEYLPEDVSDIDYEIFTMTAQGYSIKDIVDKTGLNQKEIRLRREKLYERIRREYQEEDTVL